MLACLETESLFSWRTCICLQGALEGQPSQFSSQWGDLCIAALLAHSPKLGKLVSQCMDGKHFEVPAKNIVTTGVPTWALGIWYLGTCPAARVGPNWELTVTSAWVVPPQTGHSLRMANHLCWPSANHLTRLRLGSRQPTWSGADGEGARDRTGNEIAYSMGVGRSGQ